MTTPETPDGAPFELTDAELHRGIDEFAAFQALATQCDEAPSDLYICTVEAMRLLTSHGDHASTAEIGRLAWAKLGPHRWQEALPTLLESWASRVCLEEAELSAQGHAERIAKMDGCLEEGDITSAWDSIADQSTLPPDETEVVIGRDHLIRLLDEITRLGRKLDATTTETAP